MGNDPEKKLTEQKRGEGNRTKKRNLETCSKLILVLLSPILLLLLFAGLPVPASEHLSSLLLPQLPQGQRVVATAAPHPVCLKLGLATLKGKKNGNPGRKGLAFTLSYLEVGDVLLQDPPLLVHPLPLLGHADLHVVELGVELAGTRKKMCWLI